MKWIQKPFHDKRLLVRLADRWRILLSATFSAQIIRSVSLLLKLNVLLRNRSAIYFKKKRLKFYDKEKEDAHFKLDVSCAQQS